MINIRVAIPIVLSMIGNNFLSLVDIYVIGQVSSSELAGVAAGQAIFWTLAVTGFGWIAGSEPLMAQAFGAGNYKQLRAVFSQALYIAIALSLFGIPLIIFLGYLYPFSGASPEVVQAAQPYIFAVAFSLPPLLIFVIIQRYLQAQNITTSIAVIMVGTNIINYGADMILAHGYMGFAKMGAAGIGWSSTVCRGFALLCLLGVLWHHHRSRLSFSRFDFAFRPTIVKKVSLIGAPVALQMMLEIGVFALATTLAARLGTIQLAAHQIALTLVSFTFMIPMGLSLSATVRVANYLGKNDTNGAYRNGWINIFLSKGIMIIFSVLLAMWPITFISCFSDDSNVLSIGVDIIILCALFQIFDGIQVATGGALRGAGITKVTLYANIFGHYVMGLPLGMVCCFWLAMDAKGLWIGLTSGLIITALVLLTVWRQKGRDYCRSSVKFSTNL